MIRFHWCIAIAHSVLTSTAFATHQEPSDEIPRHEVDGATILTLPGGMLNQALLSPDDRYLAVLDGGDIPYGFLILCDLKESRFIVRDTVSDAAEHDEDESLKQLLGVGYAFSPDSESLAVTRFPRLGHTGSDQVIQLLDPATGNVRQSTSTITAKDLLLRFTPDGSRLAGLEHSTGRILLFNTETMELETTLKVNEFLEDFGFSGDGSRLFVAFDLLRDPADPDHFVPSAPVTVQTWSLATGDPDGDPITCAGPWHGKEFRHRADGTLLFSLEQRLEGQRRLMVWNAETREELFTVNEPPEGDEYNRLGHTLTPDGNYAAIGYRDGSCRLVELGGGEVLAEFNHHSRLVSILLFTSDGNRLITVGWDQRVVIADIKALIDD